MQFKVLSRTFVGLFTLVQAAKCYSTISWKMSSYFPVDWFQCNCMCNEHRQETIDTTVPLPQLQTQLQLTSSCSRWWWTASSRHSMSLLSNSRTLLSLAWIVTSCTWYVCFAVFVKCSCTCCRWLDTSRHLSSSIAVWCRTSALAPSSRRWTRWSQCDCSCSIAVSRLSTQTKKSCNTWFRQCFMRSVRRFIQSRIHHFADGALA